MIVEVYSVLQHHEIKKKKRFSQTLARITDVSEVKPPLKYDPEAAANSAAIILWIVHKECVMRQFPLNPKSNKILNLIKKNYNSRTVINRTSW